MILARLERRMALVIPGSRAVRGLVDPFVLFRESDARVPIQKYFERTESMLPPAPRLSHPKNNDACLSPATAKTSATGLNG